MNTIIPCSNLLGVVPWTRIFGGETPHFSHGQRGNKPKMTSVVWFHSDVSFKRWTRSHGCVWKCCVPLNPLVFMIIIPFLNGYFIGNTPYFQTNPHCHIARVLSSLSAPLSDDSSDSRPCSGLCFTRDPCNSNDRKKHVEFSLDFPCNFEGTSAGNHG